MLRSPHTLGSGYVLVMFWLMFWSYSDQSITAAHDNSSSVWLGSGQYSGCALVSSSRSLGVSCALELGSGYDVLVSSDQFWLVLWSALVRVFTPLLCISIFYHGYFVHLLFNKIVEVAQNLVVILSRGKIYLILKSIISYFR